MIQDIEDRQSCPACKRRVRSDYRVCPTCRAELKRPCASCGRLLQLGWHVCPYCGVDVVPASVQTPSPTARVPA